MDEAVAEKVAKTFAPYQERTYEKGQILLYAGEQPASIYYLLEGRVREYDITYRGDEIVLNVFQPPAFFPMSWAVNRAESKYFYRTEEKVRLRAVPVEAALEFVRANPDVLYDLLSRVYRGTDALIGRLVQLMSGSAKSRLVYELITEADRNKPPAAANRLQLSLSETDLAARAGLSRETISREMHGLKQERLVSVGKQGVCLEDIASLRAKLDS